MDLPGPGFTLLGNFPMTDDTWTILILEDVPSGNAWSFTVYRLRSQ